MGEEPEIARINRRDTGSFGQFLQMNAFAKNVLPSDGEGLCGNESGGAGIRNAKQQPTIPCQTSLLTIG